MVLKPTWICSKASTTQHPSSNQLSAEWRVVSITVRFVPSRREITVTFGNQPPVDKTGFVRNPQGTHTHTSLENVIRRWQPAADGGPRVPVHRAVVQRVERLPAGGLCAGAGDVPGRWNRSGRSDQNSLRQRDHRRNGQPERAGQTDELVSV